MLVDLLETNSTLLVSRVSKKLPQKVVGNSVKSLKVIGKEVILLCETRCFLVFTN